MRISGKALRRIALSVVAVIVVGIVLLFTLFYAIEIGVCISRNANISLKADASGSYYAAVRSEISPLFRDFHYTTYQGPVEGEHPIGKDEEAHTFAKELTDLVEAGTYIGVRAVVDLNTHSLIRFDYFFGEGKAVGDLLYP